MPDQPPFDLTGTIRYQDRVALLSALQQTDIRPSPRPKKRPTKQTEIWTICRLLSTLAEADELEYPLSVAHKDRPDILILADGTKIGVEITEAVPPQYAEFMALAAREFPNALIEPGHFGWDSPKRTIPEMRKLLSQSKLTAPGWVGDQPEQEWAGFIEGVVRTKLEKLAAPEFAKFSQTGWQSTTTHPSS